MKPLHYLAIAVLCLSHAAFSQGDPPKQSEPKLIMLDPIRLVEIPEGVGMIRGVALADDSKSAFVARHDGSGKTIVSRIWFEDSRVEDVLSFTTEGFVQGFPEIRSAPNTIMFVQDDAASIHFFDPHSGEQVSTIGDPTTPGVFRYFAFQPASKSVYVALGSTLQRWNIETNSIQEKFEIPLRNANEFTAAIMADKDNIGIVIYDPDAGTERLTVLQANDGTVDEQQELVGPVVHTDWGSNRMISVRIEDNHWSEIEMWPLDSMERQGPHEVRGDIASVGIRVSEKHDLVFVHNWMVEFVAVYDMREKHWGSILGPENHLVREFDISSDGDRAITVQGQGLNGDVLQTHFAIFDISDLRMQLDNKEHTTPVAQPETSK